MSKSTHLPEMAGDILTFTGTQVVDTGLRQLQAFSATFAQDTHADAAMVSALPIAPTGGATWKLNLKAWKADGTTAASIASKVSWMALGK
jgi:hypothetical protein